jgi:hypothetical protein
MAAYVPHDNTQRSSTTSMQIDMTLATSYKPVLVCIAKVCALMVFHYSSASVLFVTERYAVIVAVLYIDHWLSYEYIVNTNSFASVLAISLLVHELRDAGIQERLHGELSHTILLSVLLASNVVVLVLGENQSILHLLSSSPVVTLQPASVANITKKVERSRLNQHNPVPGCSGFGPLMHILFTCTLLVMLSTCAMPVSIHDPVLTNLRVWSFTALSMIWFYTIYYKQLRYSGIAPFTPCVLRFSGILFLTPTPFAIGGVLLMGVCLVATHSWQHRPLHEMQSIVQPSTEHPNEPDKNTNRVTSVVREPSPGCVITYRAPLVLSEKSDSVLNIGSIISGSNYPGGNGGNGIAEGIADTRAADDTNLETGGVEDGVPSSGMDYNSLFQQALDQQAS